ncbi:hypothetical protein [Pseudohongiella acticola]|uniref:hypothetical protein n=1 Tax=Pseudohongiella acticola TaxID=1524254 RepID=UPI0030EBE5C2
MAKRKGPVSKAITYPGFLNLHRPLLNCQDFISLKGNSIKLLIDLGSQYNGHNNGDLCAAMSILKERGWNSNQQISKALKELLDKNLITQTRQGGLNMGPNLYAITWQPIDECKGKLDVSPTLSAPRTFK